MSELPQPYPPPDFDAYWQRIVCEALDAPLEFERSSETTVSRADTAVKPSGSGVPGHSEPLHPSPLPSGQTTFASIGSSTIGEGAQSAHAIETFRFRGIDGSTLHGWIAIPVLSRTDSSAHAVPNSPEPRTLTPEPRHPAFLWIPPYGRESLLPNEYGTREGFVSLSFNFFGHEPFHQEKYTPARGYFAEGVESPDSWVFRKMFQNAVLAFRVLAAQPEVDPGRLAAMGLSQGGGIAIWLGAWCPGVKAVCADMPFLGAMQVALHRNAYRYPLKELFDWTAGDPARKEHVLRTISYFDTLNQATRCRVPTQVSLGLKDPAVRPVTAEAIFDALPGRKLLRRYEVGHDWYPEMIENNRQWLVENLG